MPDYDQQELPTDDDHPLTIDQVDFLIHVVDGSKHLFTHRHPWAYDFTRGSYELAKATMRVHSVQFPSRMTSEELGELREMIYTAQRILRNIDHVLEKELEGRE